MTADDFSYYLNQVPGLYLKLGVASLDQSVPTFSLHNPRFDIDETALLAGVRGFAILILSAMDSEKLKSIG
jgi:metal-dependent amidase/aminoacylase/carboxypeptidase family protein